MKKFALFIAVTMLMALFPFSAAAVSDAEEPAFWASDAAGYLENYQLIPDELFSDYDAPVRRDEFAAVLMGIYDEACQNYYTFPYYPDRFTDTVSNKYAMEIKKANIMGIINGTSETTFSPDSNITREDTATLIFRLIKLMYPQEASASDRIIADSEQISGYALPSVEFCMNSGIMNGTGGDMFSPKGLLTRQEAMVLMHNICSRYKVVENGRGSAITELVPLPRDFDNLVHDGFLYMRIRQSPYSFNNTITSFPNHTLIRTPLDQSQQNKGEILFSHVDEISAYAVNQDNIFFCDRNLDRAVYSTDKNGKDMKLLYKLSQYTRSDFTYMHVEGDWLFIGAYGKLFKMRTDGTCLSIVYDGYGESPFHAEGEYIYLQGSSIQPESVSTQNEYKLDYILSRVSTTGDETELLYSNKNFDNSWAGGILFNNKFYVAVLEKGMSWAAGVPLIEIDVDTKSVRQIQIFYSWTRNESIIEGDDGVYVSTAEQNRLNLENISGGSGISAIYRIEMGRGYTTKYGDYLYFFASEGRPTTRYDYLYNIETGAFTDIYGNPVS